MKLVIDSSVLFASVQVVPVEEVMGKMEEAEKIMGKVDAGDVCFVALALSFPNEGIWTEDRHFLKQNRVKIWLTRDLLKLIRE